MPLENQEDEKYWEDLPLCGGISSIPALANFRAFGISKQQCTIDAR
jgi:hypothetical protein